MNKKEKKYQELLDRVRILIANLQEECDYFFETGKEDLTMELCILFANITRNFCYAKNSLEHLEDTLETWIEEFASNLP